MDELESLVPPPNLPMLLTDETLYSWCGHVHLWNGNATVSTTSRQLFGKPYAALIHDFPANFAALRERTFGALPAIARLVSKHSLLGYFLPFQNRDDANVLIHRVTVGSHPHIKYHLGIPASRVGNDHPLKFCLACHKEDLENHGRAFWHLSHQLPGVLVCQAHTLPLIINKTHTSPVHLRSWLLPPLNNIENDSPNYDDRAITQLHKLSRFSQAVLDMPPGSFDPQRLAWTYQHRLKDEGMLSDRGHLKTRLYATAFLDFYQPIFDLPEYQILHSVTNSSGGFVGQISRKQPRLAHPLKHLLLITWLFESMDAFLDRYRSVSQSIPSWVAPPVEPECTSDPRKVVFLTEMRENSTSITSAARTAGVSVTTGTQWARQEGINYTPRTKTLTPDKIQFARQLVLKGLDKKSIVDQAGISLVSLNRLLAADEALKERWQAERLKRLRPQYRKAFLTLVKSYPDLPVKKLRKLPGNGYMWLYRHDRDWLMEHLPSLWNPIR
ncbi:MAG: TnsD family transposase [Candidatus Thiodiazotropha sp. (ex. Lucinisca nassula)]|nr:TnsD family transposase [Candidatus Thiodiazotropha sp. (ex. Lucinisca nassula)]MBW9273070.1 TnsD family transposase [Candidatus Thiodiazotropha sp. (ex. Lucinisca nassula)]